MGKFGTPKQGHKGSAKSAEEGHRVKHGQDGKEKEGQQQQEDAEETLLMMGLHIAPGVAGLGDHTRVGRTVRRG